ncbi:MAG: hypothetical protein EXS67_05760 [Candidatus Margulisbacteria bacterium]|nr:hypothetical protein [Candidatus Margulisiibacteriota bacterium]
MMTPFLLDVGALIVAREGRRNAFDGLESHGDPDEVKEKLDTLMGLFPDSSDGIKLSNGQIVAVVGKRKIRLLETRSFQKISYDFSCDSFEMRMNDRTVDRSFVAPFLLKLDGIIELAKSQKLSVAFIPKRSPA